MYNTIWFIVFGIITVVVICLYVLCRCLKQIKKRDIYLKTLIEDLPVGLYFKDLRGNILLANKTFANMTGFSKEDIIGKNIFNIFTADHIDEIVRDDALVYSTKKSLSVDSVIPFVNSKHYYRILKTPMLDDNKDVIGYSVFLVNIDREIENESSKQSFVATLTHDLKTPTNAQLSTLNMLLQGMFGKLNDEQSQMLTLTKDSCQYMSDLIATILDAYSCDYGNIELKVEEFDIIELIYEICKTVKVMAAANNHSIEFRSRYSECFISADKLQIKRVIMNFLSNALTYSYSNCPIHIVLEKQNEDINLYVENKSEQIPENELKTIFDKFKKTKFSHFNKTSTGLGLYLAKQVIKMHNGEIYAKSFENGTCIFGFKIPVSKDIKAEHSSEVAN